MTESPAGQHGLATARGNYTEAPGRPHPAPLPLPSHTEAKPPLSSCELPSDKRLSLNPSCVSCVLMYMHAVLLDAGHQEILKHWASSEGTWSWL